MCGVGGAVDVECVHLDQQTGDGVVLGPATAEAELMAAGTLHHGFPGEGK